MFVISLFLMNVLEMVIFLILGIVVVIVILFEYIGLEGLSVLL